MLENCVASFLMFLRYLNKLPLQFFSKKGYFLLDKMNECNLLFVILCKFYFVNKLLLLLFEREREGGQ